jgi:hypothetical protein
MKLKNTIILGLILISTNTLSNGKWLDWGESSMTNLDKITSISGGILFKNRCNNGYSWTLSELIKPYREGADYYGGFYTEEDQKTADITKYETYEYSYNLFVSKNPSAEVKLINRKEYKKWVDGSSSYNWIFSPTGISIRKVFGFEKHWLELTDESYYSEILLGDQKVRLSDGLCGDGEVTSEKSANELVQDNLDQIRDFLDDDDTYRRLK